MPQLILAMRSFVHAQSVYTAIAFCHYNAEHVQPNPFMKICARARAGSCIYNMDKENMSKGLNSPDVIA